MIEVVQGDLTTLAVARSCTRRIWRGGGVDGAALYGRRLAGG